MSTSVVNIACPKCKNSNPPSSVTCSHCGAALYKWKSLLWRFAALAVGFSMLSVTWSLLTFKLIDVTFNYKPTITYEPPPKPDKPPPEVRAGGCNYVPEATDGKLKATLLIYPLSDEYRWLRGSDNTLENGEKTFPFSSDMRQLLNERAQRVICIGASSEEIPTGLRIEGKEAEGRVEEEKRAARRVNKIAAWVQEVLNKPILVRKLNIGHRDPENRGKKISANETADQRRIIIIIVLAEQEGIDFDKALLDAFKNCESKEPIFGTILTKYSLLKDGKPDWVE